MEPIGHLDGGWRPLARPVGVGATSIPADHLDIRMQLQPGGERLSDPIGGGASTGW